MMFVLPPVVFSDMVILSRTGQDLLQLYYIK